MTSAAPSVDRHPRPAPTPRTSVNGAPSGPPGRPGPRHVAPPAVAFPPVRAVPAVDAHFRAAFECAPQGVALLAADGRILSANATLCAMLGADEDRLATESLTAFLEADPAPIDFREARHRLLIDPTPLRLEQRYGCVTGKPAWGLLCLSLLNRDDVGPVFAAHLHDITERKREEERLRRLAFHDLVTGLPNRALFEERLGAAADRVAAGEGELAVLFIDLDDFKAVNDAFGHLGGDRLLRTVAERLRASVRTGDTVARYGGDEFAVLIEEIAVAPEVEAAAGRIAAHLRRPIALDPASIALSASVGIAIRRPGQREREAIMREADAAMYRAKVGRGIASRGSL